MKRAGRSRRLRSSRFEHRPLDRCRKWGCNEHGRWIQVILSRLVDNANHSVALRVRIVNHFIKLAKFERRKVTSVSDAYRKASVFGHVSQRNA